MKKHILLIGPVSDTLGGQGVAGVARHNEGLALQLKENGFKVTIWYHRQNKSLKVNEDITIIGDSYFIKCIRTLVGFISLTFKRVFAQRGLPFFRVLIIAHQYVVLKKLLKNNSFNFIHVHSLNSFTGNSLEILKKEGLNIPKIVFTDHGFWQSSNLTNDSNNPLYKNIQCNVELADNIIYISDYARDQLQKFKLFGDKFAKIENPVLSIPNDINVSETISSEIADFIKKCAGKEIILFNGYTESIGIKNLDLLLDALEHNCKHNASDNFSLIAVCNNEAKAYISSRNWSFDILPLGKQPLSVIYHLYDVCSCLVNPSTSESYGLVYIEALQYGKPVIGFYRVIDEFKKRLGVDIGFGFDAVNDSKESLAGLIMQIINRDWDAELLIEKANELTWNKKIKDFISLYDN